MRNSVLALIGAVFVLLLIGLFFTSGGASGLPYIEQVSNPEGSTLQLTSNQGTTLAILVFVVLGSIGMMGATLYAVMWFLNREVTYVQQQPNQPFELLTMGSSGEGGEMSLTAMLADNALLLVIGVGVLMTAIAVLVIVLT